VRIWTSEEDQHATLLRLPPADGQRRSRCPGTFTKAMLAAGWSHALADIRRMTYTAIQRQRPAPSTSARLVPAESAPRSLGRYEDRQGRDPSHGLLSRRREGSPRPRLEPLGPLANVMIRFEMPWSGSGYETSKSAEPPGGAPSRLSDYLDEVMQPLVLPDWIVARRSEKRRGGPRPAASVSRRCGSSRDAGAIPPTTRACLRDREFASGLQPAPGGDAGEPIRR
jgi:hypothetical protein